MNVFCIHYSKICYVHIAHELYTVVTCSCLDFAGIKFSERSKQSELLTFILSGSAREMDKDLAELISTLTLFSTQHSLIKMLSNW